MADWTKSKTFLPHDDYMTPSYAWDWIKDYIPKDKVIWEAFYGDGTSGEKLRELGFNVIHKQVDFFKNDMGEIVVSNPPFSKSKEILTRLKDINKPFILIMPSAKITTNYFAELFKNENIKIIIPPRRINFIKQKNGRTILSEKDSRCSFDCFYYCWKLDVESPSDIIFL